MKTPTREEWRRLFAAAQGFAALRPWERMGDCEIFGVVDPESGEIGWCSVIGALGESLGLVVNVGDEGLAAFDLLQTGAEPSQVGPTLHGLVFTLDDRRDLDKSDLAPIRALGLTFRGRQAWPCFRSLRPGHGAWRIDGAEARFLATMLEQAEAVCARVGVDLDLLADPKAVLVRRPGESGGWEERWQPRPAPQTAEEPAEPPVDEARVMDVGRRCARSGDRWECGQFPLFAQVSDRGQRPYFPAAFLIVHAANGLILHADINRPPMPPETVQAAFLGAIEKVGAVPREVAVADPHARRALGPVAGKLGIAITEPDSLPAFEDARASLEQHIG
jgi:hypothetical protein